MKDKVKYFLNRVTIILILAITILVVIEALWARHKSPMFVWHDIPGVMAMIGFISCIILANASKLLGTHLLFRKEEDGN
jgi:hypothetical protein